MLFRFLVYLQVAQNQSHDGLMYVQLSFADQQKEKTKKKNKSANPKPSEPTVYDAVQFGVVGEAYQGNDEEENEKK